MKYRFNNRELDTGARAILAGGAELHVEPQVFDLILYLLENRARTVGKDELLARVWKGRLVSDATIASRINAARQALGDDGRRQNVIRTLSRQGFRFMAEVEESGDRIGLPAVAVLPFALLGGDPSLTYLARGLADQLAATLGQAAWFEVRDTGASFADRFAGEPPGAIGQALAADYLVGGTLAVEGTGINLAVRLAEARNGRQVWSASFRGQRDEVFALQDEMARRVLGEIEPRLRHLELGKSAARHGNLTAFDHYLRAADALRPMTLSAMKAAVAELDLAVETYPDYGAAHGMRAWIATLMLPQGHVVDSKAEAERSRRAVRDGAYDADALAMGGYALGFFAREPLAGLDYLRRALAINPSSARAHDHAGWLLLYAGQAAEARVHFDTALALCPIDEFAFRMLTGRAFARLFRRDFDGATQDARRAHATAPDYTVCHRVLAAALAHAGHGREARSVMGELLRINPGMTVARYGRDTRFEGTGDRELLFGGLRLAGLS